MSFSLQKFQRNLVQIAISLVLATLIALPASAITTIAKQALIIDAETGTILFSKSPDEPMAPSSMTKIMTAMVVFDHVATGKIDLSQRLRVSKKSWAKGGSKMFLREGTYVEVEKLLKGLIVQSGNDASIALAEGIAGTEDEFVELMNQRAKDLGMNTTNFENASGWPDDNHFTTARDLTTLSQALINLYPDFYHYFSIPSFKYSDIFQKNRNPLLKKKAFGADGIKTGFTSAGGYGITGSALLNGRRTIMVLNGMPSKSARISESEKMMDWAQRSFDNYSLFKAGQVVDYGHVWLGQRKRVPLVVSNELRITMPVGARSNLKAKIM
ncbi:MAG: D-alanyl-D-alanine carboxypeptidase family protein [Alphaproteobacteria bacterium]